VAIIDFDVHHGNGTQEIVECLKPKKFVVKTNMQFAAIEASSIQYRPWLDKKDP
jgi:acetoin utilization deacetylase AcuC-like enzyme